MKKGQKREKIIPTIIAKNQKELEKMIFKVDSYVNLIQLDVMDGKFVENKSNFFDFSLPTKGIKYEAHLMVEDPEAWIDEYGDRVDTIIVHVETVNNLEGIIKKIRDKKKRVGVALNPETSIQEIRPYLGKIDQVLVMTVHPGQYGAEYLPEMENKIRELRTLYQKDIEVDGGITPDTISKVKAKGANMFCSGSYIMKSPNAKEAIDSLKKAK